ncbi:type VI secretion system tip protein VgrG [Lewinella sp. W8]|uniref:type VI secretion system tip protein VgrG n=1 Tax=Lewinella sp. W8 TaxID=2528208 RepID=UPI001067F1E0|nr:type VI secretion system tip protein VgrG [Lewinella sp. W8]MTB52945.1 type VI secretion system tip protein VgrG [Lewinella sp. W8]
MPTTPINPEMDYVSFDLLIDGKDISDAVDVLSVEVEREINKVSRAVIAILLPRGDSNDKDFAISEQDNLAPGGELEIKLGYESKNKTVFKGLILRQRLKARGGRRTVLEVVCQDKAVKLTLGQKIRNFADKKDSDILSAVIGETGLEKEVEATTYQHKLFVQPQLNDWDFILTRAEANGMIVYTNDGKLMVKKPTSSDDLSFEVDYDTSVLEFDGELDASQQLPATSAKGWDFASGDFVEGKSAEPTVSTIGNITGKKLSETMGSADVVYQMSTPLESGELKGLADGVLLRSRLASVRGRVVFFGNATPELNKLITLKGFGARFNGKVIVSRVRHVVREGLWRTEVGFGIDPEWYFQRSTPHTAKTLLPAIQGLQNATVEKIDADEGSEHRIKVKVPVLDCSIWARLGTFYATNGQGTFFMPEVGDEVIVGFINDDPRFAVILGSLYSSKNAPAYTADADNSIKAFTTKAQLKIELNDKDKILTIETPAGNKCTYSDKDSSIVIADQNSNTITMDSNGITLKSGKDITLQATGNVNVKANQAISAQASGGDVALKGLNVTANGNVGVTLKGGATAELSAGGNTTVKGAMVMIN